MLLCGGPVVLHAYGTLGTYVPRLHVPCGSEQGSKGRWGWGWRGKGSKRIWETQFDSYQIDFSLSSRVSPP